MTAHEALDGLDEYRRETLEAWNFPGVAVGVVHGDRPLYAKGHGYRDYGAKRLSRRMLNWAVALATR